MEESSAWAQSVEFNSAVLRAVFRLTLDVSPKTKAKSARSSSSGTREEKNIHHRKIADIQTYIDMMLGMKLLQAATESGYPQSWACLSRHADSLCCWAPVFKPPSSRHTVVVTRVTPNLAETCCRDARIIKFYRAYLYGRRVPGLRVKSQPTGQSEKRNSIWLPSLCSSQSVMWSPHLPASSPPETVWQSFGDDDECNVLIRSILFEDVDSVEV